MKNIYPIVILSLFASCEPWNIFGSNTGGPRDSSGSSSVAKPTGIALLAPTGSPTLDMTPELTISGVESGDTVKVYSDTNCNTEVGTGVATGTSLNIILNSQNPGSYSFYSKRIKGDSSSSCSTASVDIVISACPTNFIPVPHNTDYTNDDFCVAKYEMKDVTGTATSQISGNPEVSINLADATTSCSNLGVGYTLVSNSQWQTIARDIELVSSNWDGGVVGTGNLNTGHSDNDPSVICDATQEYVKTDCNNSGTEPNFKQKRTHRLSNTEVIWDFSGNVSEWVIDTNTGSTDYGTTAYINAITAASHTATGSLLDSVNRSAKAQFGPIGDYSALASPHGGMGYGEFGANVAIYRGSNKGSGFQASGIFTVKVTGSTSSFTNLGYRCAYSI